MKAGSRACSPLRAVAGIGWAMCALGATGAAADLTENFDAGTAVPAGWIDGGTVNDAVAGHPQSPPNCRAMGAGDTLQTPVVDFPTNVSFYVDASTGGNNKTATIDYSIGGGGWALLGSFVSTTAGSTKNFPLNGSPDLSAVPGVRFRFNSTYSTWYLDDVAVKTGGEAPSNSPPYLTLNPAETNRAVLTGETLAVTVTVGELDGDEVTLSATGLPDGATFAPNPLVGTAPLTNVFAWTPTEPGEFAVVFRAEDKDGANEKTVHYSASDPDPTILLEENFDDSASLPAGWIDGGTVNDTGHVQSLPNCRALGAGDALTTPPVDFPTNLSFYVDCSDNGNNQTAWVLYRIGTGEWVQLGTFVAHLAGATESFSLMTLPDVIGGEDVQFQFVSVFNTWYLDDVLIRGQTLADQPPALAPIGDRMVAVGQTLRVEVAATDFDGHDIALSASNLPPGAVFEAATNAGAANGLLTYAPEAEAAGMVYTSTFYAVDVNGATEETIEISVHDYLVGFAVAETTVWENEGTPLVAVAVSRPVAATVELVPGGTAVLGAEGDWELPATQLVFTAEGSCTQWVALAVRADDEIEPTETAVLTLTNAAGAAPGPLVRHVVRIRDAEAALFEPLDEDPGWRVQGQWAFGSPQGRGGSSGYPDPTAGFTGTNVYGYNLAGDYADRVSNTYYLTTLPIDCTRFRNLKFEFQRWLGIESASYDHACVQVSTDGESWMDLWVHEGYSSISDFAWTNMAFDLDAQVDGQPTVFFRWGLGPIDDYVHYCGWNVDDVALTGDAVTNAMFRFASTGYSVVETQSEAVVTIERIGLTNTEATIVLAATGGTATAGTDYAAIEETVTFAPGERSRAFAIPVHDDGDVEGDETVELSLRATATGDVATPAETMLLLLDDESPGAAIPFFDGFESGELGESWTQRSTDAARIRVGAGNAAPYEGTNQLCMELTNYYARGLNEAVLTVDLSGQTDVVLRFYENTLEYQHQAMPVSFTGSAEADGVAVSTDGIHWLRLFDPPSYSWESYGATNRTINLSAFAATHGLVPGAHFKIKFQHFDDLYRYGRYFDNVQVYDPAQVADVRLAVATSEDPVEIGTELTYSLVVSNAGPMAATGLVVSNRLPPGSVFVSVSGSLGACRPTEDGAICEIDALPAGGAATLELVVEAPAAPATLHFQGWARGAEFDPATPNNRTETFTAVDERGGTIELAVAETDAMERAGNVTLAVVRSDRTYGEITVDYATADGTAVAGADYAATNGQLRFANGQTIATITIPIRDDELDEPGEALELHLSNPGNEAVLGSNVAATIRIRDDDGRAGFPFLETFESGALSNYWRTYSTAAGQIQVTTNNGPAAGSQHLTMDVADYGYALNELVLTADLAGQSGVTLSFWHREFNDYAHVMSNAFAGHHPADGVALSVDGENWAKVQGLTDAEGSSNEYRRFEIALDPILAEQGWAYTGTVQIKFQQYDYYWIPYRGFAFDDVALFSRPGELSFAQAALEASETNGAVTVTVARNNGTLGEISVPFAVADGTAVAPDDYVATNGVLTFADGAVSASFAVELVDDADDEQAETLLLTLGDPTGGATLAPPSQAVLTVHDDDGAGLFAFETDQTAVSESNDTAWIYVWRLEGAEGAASVDYVVSGGTATAGADYVAATGTVSFGAGITSRYFTVALLDDVDLEDTESILMRLTNASPGAAIGSPDSSVLNVLDDEDPNYDYYLPAYGLEGAAFRQALHDVIDGHQTFSYTPALWTILQEADECPTNPAQVQLVYMQIGRDKNNNGALAGQWNREHVWPQSHGAGNPYGSGDPDPSWPSSVDAHHLKPADVVVNSWRGNSDFESGGTQVAGAPASCRMTDSTFEPPDASKGDIARILFYMDVRYAGDEENEPDLKLVDAVNTYGAELGRLSTLLAWHLQDPPDEFERRRNDLIYANWQRNRNPFIDHPEWAFKLWAYSLSLATRVQGGGHIAPENPQVAYNADQFFEIQPEPYWHVVDVRTNGVSLGASCGTASFSFVWGPIVSTGTLEAVFAENLAAHGTPEWWLAGHGFSNDFDLAELTDLDFDGMPAWQEFRANTDPGSDLSLLQIEEIAPATDGNETVLRWQSASNRVYSVWRSAALPDGFGLLVATNLPADPPLNVYTDRIDGAATRFYRIEAQP
ncbi:MAG: Calx-beta domain-containing protein [Kiritimatiellia bacterium]